MKTTSLLIFCFIATWMYGQDYYEDRLFIKLNEKVRSTYSLDKEPEILKLVSPKDILSIKQVSKHPLLSQTYEVIFTREFKLEELVQGLEKLEYIDYAEKVPMYKLFFTPNDPSYSGQWNLTKIQADLAWNLTSGCSNIKIAITDDGYLLNHEDLVNQWHINTGEIMGNGLDDDGNGYVDDWRGWDAGSGDNDPSASVSTSNPWDHGTHVAGIVAAQTNNSKGIAAIGFNCKMIPIKIANNSYSLTGAFAGLDYAINGTDCDVINMSWGGAGFSATYQTLFNIAKSKGILCVAAAGNSNTSAPMYPASYNHVISVAASGASDARASFTNFGTTIDVTAPGVGIFSCITTSNSAYGNKSGTSMAAPLVAGLCGLMKCYNPLPADSIEACLKRTCDNIHSQNPSFIGQLGAGRVNAFQALQCLTKKPKSDFIALDTFQCIGKSVRFVAKSYGVPTLTYNWSFPGGSPSTSTLANPVVSYTTNGPKTVTLITCNSLGCDTITQSNIVKIDTPRAWLTGRRYSNVNSNPVLITVHFRGNPPYQVTLTDGTNTFSQSNIQVNPFLFALQPKLDTSVLTILSYSDSSCAGITAGRDTIYKTTLTKDTTVCVTLKTSDNGATDLMIFYNTNSPTTYTWSNSSGEFTTERWTTSGSPTSTDGILKFNLSGIPTNAIINSASISLYANVSVANWSGEPTAGSNNSANFSRVTSNWSISSLPNIYPNFSTINQISLAQTPNASSNHTNINVKNLIQDIISSGSNNGILFHLKTNSFYNSLQMHSWQSSDTSKHPKLVLCYTIPAGESSGGGNSDCDTTNLNTGKVLHLDFNGNTQDKSGLGNHATNFGATPVAGKDGIANTAYRFDSTNYMSVAHHASLNLRSFTMTAILKPLKFNTDVCYTNTVISKGTASVGAQLALQYAPTTSTTCFNRDTTNCNMLLCGSACPTNSVTNTQPYMVHNKWECAVVSYDSVTKEIKMYMNGVLRHQWTSTFTSLTSQNAAAVLIGKFGDPNYPGFIQAVIDDIRIYNRVLAPAEVKGYCGTCNTSASSDCDTANLNTGKVLHLDFNGNTQDKSGNNNHATNYGATPVAGKDGVVNTAYRFDGVNDYMQVANASSINNFSNNKITLCTILRPRGFYNGTCKGNSIIMKGNTDYITGNYLLRYSPNNGCSSSADTNQNNFYGAFSAAGGCSVSQIHNPPYVKRDTWYCVVGVYTGDSIYTYVNGEKKYSCSYTGSIGSHNMDLFIGKLDNSTYPYWLNADVDDIRIYNRVLAPSEVKGYCGTCTIGEKCVFIANDTCMVNDAVVASNFSNSNMGNHPEFFGSSWTCSGSPCNIRSYINFNLSQIPTNGVVTSAKLYLKALPAGTAGNGYSGQPTFGTNNSCTIRRVTQSWDEYSVTWNNKPSTTNQNEVTLAQSSSNFQNYEVNMLNLIKDQLANPSTSFGFELKHIAEGTSYNSMIFGSTDHPIDSLRPRLEICYFVPNGQPIFNPKPIECDTKDCDTTNLSIGKVLHLDFNGNTQDKSGLGNHATNFGATPAAGKDGIANTAYRFDGVNDYMKIVNSSSLSLDSNFTVTAKIKIDGWNSALCRGNMIFFKGFPVNIASNPHYDLAFAPNAYTGSCSAPLDTAHQNLYIASLTSSAPTTYMPYLRSKRWYCFVSVQKSNDTNYIYIDGNIVYKQYSRYNGGNNNYDIFLGKSDYASYPFWINATYDDIRVYNRVLTLAEVKGYCEGCSELPIKPCDTSRRFLYTQCLNDSAQLTMRPGTQYQWSPKNGLSSDTARSPKIYMKTNQRYFVSYTGVLGCQVMDTIDLNVKPSAIYPKIEDQLICIGDSVQIEIPIYATNILWSPNLSISSTTAKNPFFFPTTNRTYYLEFRDSLGCMQRDTFDINAKICCPARARFSIPKELLCFGENLTITNNSKGPITSFNWNFGNSIPNSFSGVNPPTLTFPDGGAFPLRLIVSNGACFDTMLKTVFVVRLQPNAGRDTTNCLGAFSVQLGDEPVSDWKYNWTPANYLSNSQIANPVCNIVNDSVNYILEVQDLFSGCKGYDTVKVYTNRNLDSLSQQLRICDGDSVLFDGSYRKTTENYFYTVKKADGVCDSFINILRLQVLVKQIVYLDTIRSCDFYMDVKGKRHVNSFIDYDTIRSKSIPNCDSLIKITPVVIYQRSFKTRDVSGCAPFRYKNRVYMESKMKADSIRIRNIYLFGCDTIEYINVVVHPKPKAIITPTIPNPVMYKQTVTLFASGGQTYWWLQTGSTDPVLDYQVLNTIPKLFTVRVTDFNGCWDTISYVIQGRLPDTCYYGFPNAFSPNNDNLNDEYFPNIDDCTDIIVFSIYNRWGEKVFETNKSQGWNGLYRGSPAPSGVYIYYVEFKTPWGIRKHNGSFTLVR